MAEEKKGFFARLKEGLNKTRNNIVSGIDSVFSGFSAIDDEFYEELEETLIMGDIGVNATSDILDRLKKQVKERHIKEPSDCRQLLIDSIREQMQVGETAYDFEKKQSVIGDRRERGGKNHLCREACRHAEGAGQKGAHRRGRYLPRGRRRAARGLGQPGGR